MFTDTILAISSPPAAGSGIRGIVRLSGPAAWPLARAISDLPESAHPGWHGPLSLTLWNAKVPCAALLFKAPRSFTGQDIAELHLPNSPAILRSTLDALLRAAATCALPARLAEPGEFSARAFFNGKIDLTQAEGIAATINAANQTELRAAASLREGDLHREITALADRIANVLALIEAGIDFADEEGIRFIGHAELAAKLNQAVASIDHLLATCVRIDQLSAPPTVAFIGKPNVGKSSLINALAGLERSIVSPIAGTTRDILPVILKTPRGEIRLLDMPGDELPDNELSRKMMEARSAALLDADLVLEIIAAGAPAGAPPENHTGRHIVIQNKVDLPHAATTVLPEPWQRVSAKTRLHIRELRDAIGSLATRRETHAAGRIVLNHRHRQALKDSSDACTRAAVLARTPAAEAHPEFLAAELRAALDQLGQITGTISPDEVLGRIFAQFCIGK